MGFRIYKNIGIGRGGGGGGGARKTVRTPLSNIVELKERIMNLHLNKIRTYKKKRYEGSKMGGRRGTTLCSLHFHVFLYLFLFRVGFTRE